MDASDPMIRWRSNLGGDRKRQGMAAPRFSAQNGPARNTVALRGEKTMRKHILAVLSIFGIAGWGAASHAQNAKAVADTDLGKHETSENAAGRKYDATHGQKLRTATQEANDVTLNKQKTQKNAAEAAAAQNMRPDSKSQAETMGNEGLMKQKAQEKINKANAEQSYTIKGSKNAAEAQSLKDAKAHKETNAATQTQIWKQEGAKTEAQSLKTAKEYKEQKGTGGAPPQTQGDYFLKASKNDAEAAAAKQNAGFKFDKGEDEDAARKGPTK